MPQPDTSLKRDFFIENLLFHRARKLYFWMVSFLGKLTRTRWLLWGNALTGRIAPFYPSDFRVKFLPTMKTPVFFRVGLLWSIAAILLLAAVSPPLQAQDYIPLDGLRVSDGRVQFGFASAGQCIQFSNSSINGVVYTTHISKWQKRAGSSWVDIPGTERNGLCSYSPTSPGEYRLVAEISINGERGYYSSENTLTVEGAPGGTGPAGTESFSFPDLGGWSTTSSGTEETVRVGYGRISADVGSTTPSGIAIFQYRASQGVLIAEASVPATGLIQEGRIFAEVEGPVNTGLAIANPNDVPAIISFYFTDTTGTNLGSGNFELGEHEQTARFLNQEPFNEALPDGSPVLGTFTFESSVPIAVIALRGFTNEADEFLMTTLPVAPLSPASEETVYIPHFAAGGGWVTQVILVNPTDSMITGTVGFLGPGSGPTEASPVILTLDDGSTGSDFDYSIPPRSSQRVTTSNPFGALNSGSVRAVPDSGNAVPSGLVVFSYAPAGKTLSEAGVPALPKGSAFRAYAEASGMPGQMGSISTGLAITNVGDTSNTVTLEVTHLDGSLAAAPEPLTLPPSGQVARFLNEIFSLPDNFSGVLRVTSTADIAIVALRLRVNEKGEIKVTTLAPSNETDPPTSENRFFAHLADSEGWSTQFILFSGTAGQAASGTLSFIDTEGEPWDLTTDSGVSGSVPPSGGAYADLVLASASVSSATPMAGQPFELRATVDNRGTGASTATTLRFYRSTDTTISSIDTEVGTDAVSALAAGGISSSVLMLTALSTAGTYYYGACVDPVSGESNSQNNCSSAVRVTVSASHPDRVALVALYNATDGPNWVNNENWLTDAPLRDWYGVATDASGRVVRVDLAGRWDSEAQEWIPYGLSGPIPPELGSLANLQDLYLNANELTGTIPAELGSLANLTRLDLFENQLSGPIPPELGRLADLESLDVFGNDLSGPIPPELGELASLTRLQLGSNSLTGTTPRSLLDLTKLTRFYFQGNEGLCAPGVAGFADWLGAMEDTSGPYCNESDLGVLNLLYETSGGPDWTNSSRWLETPALDEWYGVTADTLGRVVTLDLSRNGLAGELPGTLGELAHVTELRIADNPDLSGRLPLSLARLSLRTLHYAGTELCAPAYESFREWLRAIPSHEGTDAECVPLSDREVLEVFYEATGGPDWYHNDNWLTDAPLGDWYGVEVDGQGRVTELYFNLNRLTGRLPPELGSLANLRSLFIWLNGTTGPIPPELGNLANLQSLRLMGKSSHLTGSIPPELGRLANLQVLEFWNNDLTGPIPPELGGLTDLRHLALDQNRLTGPIPPELGGLANLNSLHLSTNDLSGPIPPELGGLANLRSLNLATNRLTGPIPPGLDSLADLESLYLGDNELTGSVPPVLGGLMHLRHLALQTNAGMSGALPASLTNLAFLETLQTSDTGLCAPSDAGFLDWLERVASRQVALCGHEPAMAYLVQAVQSREFPVPLVAGEEALLRVFVTAGRDNDERLPPVRASLYLNGALAHVAEIADGPGPIPTEVDEGSLATSVNAVVPAEVVRPGLEMVVEIDPDGTLDSGLGVARRIPEMGRAAVDVRAVPLLDLTLVPFLWAADPDSAILEPVVGMAADPEGHELLGFMRMLLPVGDLDVKAHEPVLSSSNDGFELVEEVRAIRVMEGGSGYWMGTMSGPFGTAVIGTGGIGLGAASFVILDKAQDVGPTRHFARVTAHEFGHNFSLGHAPSCGAGIPDSAYPKPDGSIGVWGYDFRDGSLVPPSWTDVMGYCEGDPEWISDYHFSKALHFRLFDEQELLAANLTAQQTESLLLWGGADADGELYLNPAFVVDAPPVLPDAAGEHRISGRTADGDELFSLDFALPETAAGDGRGSFVFALPADPAWAGNLASITLSGPTGSATLAGDTDLPMTVLLDPVSGQVRAILRDLPPVAKAARDTAGRSAEPGLDMIFSRGIPAAAAWRR